MGRKVISVSIDLGSDTTKAAYSYLNDKGDYAFDLLFDHGAGLPSMAYYDAVTEDWIFDKKDILQRAQSSFCYLVKVKDLLDLFATRAKDHLYTSNYFKTFYYPPKEFESYLDAVEGGRCFTASSTPKEVCASFVKYCVKKIEEEISSRFGDVLIRYVVVYPANASKAYIKELVGFVSAAAPDAEDVFIISAPRAVGVAAKEYGVVTKEKNVLLFNIGEEEISVVKMYFDRSNISVYSADGHSSPAKIGGKNIDIALASYLFERSATIKSFGDVDAEQEVEKGMFYDQFRMQEGIKSGKKVFSNGVAYERLGGFVFSIYREMITQVKIVQSEFEACCYPVFRKIWEYVRDELKGGDNTDVEAVIFSGGAADTYGLDRCIKEKLSENFPKVRFLDFSPENEEKGYDDILCEAKDTVPIGAALYGAGKYKFKLLTTFAYGTYRGSKLAESNGYAFDPFVPKGKELDLVGKPDFKVEMLAAKPLFSKPKVRRGRLLIFNEYYKCPTPEGFDDKRHVVVFKHYTPDRDFKTGAAAENIAFSGICLLDRTKSSVVLKRMGCYLIVYSFPESFKGNAESIAPFVFFKEGFSIDFEGRVTPIIRNVSEQAYRDKNLMGEYRELYQQVKFTLIPNGTGVMSINN